MNPSASKNNSSPYFVSQKDVLQVDKLRKIFIRCTDTTSSKLMLRYCSSQLGSENGKDWKDSDLSQIYRINV